MLDDCRAVLDLAQDQLDQIGKIYEESLREKKVTPRLQAIIKNILENQRSALDYVAHAVTEKHGKPGMKTYWPYSTDRSKFVSFIDSNMPGVRSARPDIADEIAKYQPTEPGYDCLGYLAELNNENKHRKLTPQTRTEHHRREVHGPDGGKVSWDPNMVTFGGGPGGRVEMFGQAVNPATQRTVDTIDVIYVGWLFSDLDLPVRETLQQIQAAVDPITKHVCHVAGL
jgi:hypothetical protein